LQSSYGYHFQYAQETQQSLFCKLNSRNYFCLALGFKTFAFSRFTMSRVFLNRTSSTEALNLSSSLFASQSCLCSSMRTFHPHCWYKHSFLKELLYWYNKCQNFLTSRHAKWCLIVKFFQIGEKPASPMIQA
jgi:hypothetical protein